MASNPTPPSNPGYRPTGVVDLHGNPYEVRTSGQQQKANPGYSDSGGGGAMKLTLPDLRWNVALLNAAAVLFMASLVGMFLWMVDRIDDKFEAVMLPLQSVQQSSASQGEKINAINDKIDRLLDQQEGNDDKAIPKP